ncbi:MAG: chromate efflux transporter [Chitinophagaceae bacterium]|nr:chromate efflux transporter [Chitinophagaceae bacterium]
MSNETVQSPVVSLRYLFFTFLKIGMVSFGGHMGLVAVVKNIMADKDKTLKHETILDAVGIGSLLPGPLAVNVVAYIGYAMRKTAGAIISMTGVILPACIAMLLLSWAYFKYGYQQQFKEIMYYVTGAVSAIILSTGLQLYVKELKGNTVRTIICIAGIAGILLTNNYVLTIGFIVAGGILGSTLKLHTGKLTGDNNNKQYKFSRRPGIFSIIILMGLLCLVILFVTNAQQYTNNILLKLIILFSGISLTLFGGGYVMIPIMQTLFVSNMGWLTQQEFLDAIALSQSTPGPILVSATFIGYKMAGFTGAIVATIAIFAPSAILKVLVAKAYLQVKEHVLAKNILSGVKAVVIGLIIGAAIKIGGQLNWNIPLALITAGAFICSFRYRLSPVYIILSSALCGFLIWYFSK